MSNLPRFNFYEYADTAIPGAVFVLALLVMFEHPAAATFTDWSVGTFLLFFLVSYATGHGTQIVGTVLEAFWWKMLGGMPADWIRSRPGSLLPNDQTQRLEGHLKTALDLPTDFSIAKLDGRSWYFITRQMSSLVSFGAGKARIDYLQGNYNLSRGLSASLFCASLVIIVADPYRAIEDDPTRLFFAILVLGFAILALFRMQRFGVQSALELYAQFMLLEPRTLEKTAAVPADRVAV